MIARPVIDTRARHNLLEGIARLLCATVPVHPDARVNVGEPHLVPGGYVIQDYDMPAWHLFRAHAKIAIDAILDGKPL